MESTPVNILNDLAIPQWVLTFFAFYGLGILLVVWGAVMDLLDTDELTPPKELGGLLSNCGRFSWRADAYGRRYYANHR